MSVSRPEPPFRADERSTLLGFLEFLRATIVLKCEGLNEEQLRSTPTASSLSLISMVKHLSQVERYWFQGVMEDREITFLWSEERPNGDFVLEDHETAADILLLYGNEIAISNEIVAQHALEDTAAWARSEDERVSMRYILTHMIEETGRHCGHADILRESIDGATGE